MGSMEAKILVCKWAREQPECPTPFHGPLSLILDAVTMPTTQEERLLFKLWFKWGHKCAFWVPLVKITCCHLRKYWYLKWDPSPHPHPPKSNRAIMEQSSSGQVSKGRNFDGLTTALALLADKCVWTPSWLLLVNPFTAQPLTCSPLLSILLPGPRTKPSP